MSSEPVPYTIDIPQADVDDLRSRLRATRWLEPMADDWSLGTAHAELRTLVEHWGGAYDWRSAESHLNSYPQVMVDVAGERVHAVRAGTPGATPLLLIHGWPDSFLRFDRALPLLAERFDIVVPSIPGYGFSDRPRSSAGPVVIAGQMAELMSALGLEQFMVHGADIGSQIAEQLTLQHPERVLALHLGDIPLRRPRSILPQDATDDELAWQRNAVDWELEEGAYSHLQRTKPQTLAASLNDSPAGLASWIFEKFHTWSDHGDDIFDTFTLDDLATNLSIYWFTQTAGSAARYYLDGKNAQYDNSPVTTPTGFAVFPKDLLRGRRSTAERWYNVQRWTDMPTGGHFGPWEQPAAWSKEIVAFANQLGA